MVREVRRRHLEYSAVRDLEDRRERDPRSALAPNRVPALDAAALDIALLHGPNRLERILGPLRHSPDRSEVAYSADQVMRVFELHRQALLRLRLRRLAG